MTPSYVMTRRDPCPYCAGSGHLETHVPRHTADCPPCAGQGYTETTVPLEEALGAVRPRLRQVCECGHVMRWEMEGSEAIQYSCQSCPAWRQVRKESAP